MKNLLYIFFFASLLLPIALRGQTPYDSFAPEATRPMIEREALYPEGTMQTEEPSTDTVLCVAVVDLQRQTLLLINIHDNTIIGTAPLSDDVLKWLSVDPLADKNIATSPYMYCNGNPIIFVDPDGRDWYKDEEGEIKWTDYHSQEELKTNGLKGQYLGEAVVVFSGYRDERFGTINGKGKYIGGENAKLAEVTLYGSNGEDDITRGLIGFTMTSDYEKYGAIDDGIWPGNYDSKGKSGKIPSHWTLNNRGLIPTYDYQPNESPYAGKLKGTMYKNGIFIHSTLSANNRVGRKTSVGCLLLDWNSMKVFNERMNGVKHFSVIVYRR
ncbi:MAG: hypothetical protein E7074_09020 [Bacteroidales bacterium]|nr:hypothetical protein [Bacteroidales bacterium]